MIDLLIPGIMVLVSCISLWKKQDVYSALIKGGENGLRIVFTIIPSLIMLLSATISDVKLRYRVSSRSMLYAVPLL